MRRIVVIGLLAGVAPALLSCGSLNRLPAADPSGPAEAAEAFDSPPAWPGPHWSLNGAAVAWDVISTAAGPAHCGSQAATFMHLGWPPGTASKTSQQARQYIRDPHGVVRSPYLRAPLDLDARLRAGAHPTGLTYGQLRVYAGSDADTAIYVVGRHRAERWPRSDPMTLCA